MKGKTKQLLFYTCTRLYLFSHQISTVQKLIQLTQEDFTNFIQKENQANAQIQQPKIDSQFLLQIAQQMAEKEREILEKTETIQLLENV